MSLVNKIKIAIVDDNTAFRKGLTSLLQFVGYDVAWEYKNGKDLISNIDANDLPNFVFIDIEMPQMDGYETNLWLKENFPAINVLALIMNDNDFAISRMENNGAKGYIFKDAEPNEIKSAIHSVLKNGHYHPNRNRPFF